ncbi:Cellobiose 2-epimerase [Streptomyces sp. YIM 121038]|uniref:AGE family epimerase/isomerase n=1 Tax=Streptomyces sp. YIM 121038 TaxID=2136401 RepID=UPI001110C82A|nr:AGE family epimerase/isomerase [Streptomyces sp. YIM 121038]QCX73799.1 Cellobiose 2-epimerase [Streptomyces sp. YIM 121038]QCX82020.1 Cellobiose 2-epimerase [Streptomyces sp. YIM 121038]
MSAPAVLPFSFSDLSTGYVTGRLGSRFTLTTPDGREVLIHLSAATTGQRLRNLGEPYQDVTGQLADLLTPGTYVFVYGPIYPAGSGLVYQADRVVIAGGAGAVPPWQERGWWTRQLTELACFYRRSQFGAGAVDFAEYRTEIHGSGHKTTQHVQETDTLSRLVYGMASAYLLTGNEDFLDVAERGSRYLHEHLRFHDPDEGIVYWYHGVDVAGPVERKLFASEFGDDYRAIPAYEQIYALVGLAQTYRVTGAPRIKQDLEATVKLFDTAFYDPRLGGYFSHIDPVTLSPHHDSLGPNRSRKNWNSVGDHAPAYLINLYLATGEERYRRMLEHTFDMIVTHLPDRSRDRSVFVNERFHADWTPDHDWGWQQNRAVVGHNLKIVWNLMRMHAVLPKREYRQLAEQLAAQLPAVGRDGQRGGWYDVLEREAEDGRHAFAWHDRKTWWQQEQAILAYLVLAGATGQDTYTRHADEAAAFYNAFFLDHDEGGVHFTVLASGIPYLLGNERLKGSHAMAMYHKAELCYLAEVYTRLLVRGEPLDLWFKPHADADFPDNLLRVAPDLLPPGRVELEHVLIDGAPYSDFDAEELTVRLPRRARRMTVQVRLRPAPARP